MFNLNHHYNFFPATDGCNDDGWSPYSDEKCIKVFQHATTSYDEAEAFCALQVANGGGGDDEDNEEIGRAHV